MTEQDVRNVRLYQMLRDCQRMLEQAVPLANSQVTGSQITDVLAEMQLLANRQHEVLDVR